MKKSLIFALMGMSTLLAGCTIPGVPDPQQVADQTRMLSEMQQQMTDLLSGMNALQEQNDHLSGLLVSLQTSIESQKVEDTETHEAAPLSDDLRLFGGSGSFEDFGSGVELPNPEVSILTGNIGTGDLVSTGDVVSTGDADTHSLETSKSLLLQELKKAALKESVSSGDNTTGSMLDLLE